MKLNCPVFIIGFMGAGKTSVARKIARETHVTSVDADTYLERNVGRRIADVFANEGEELFRKWEADALATLAASFPMVIACGGGIVTTEQARETLRSRGYVVYLKVDVEEAASRIGKDADRPLFTSVDATRALWQQRQPLYESLADTIVETSNKGINAIAHEVIGALRRAEVLVDDDHATGGTKGSSAHGDTTH